MQEPISPEGVVELLSAAVAGNQTAWASAHDMSQTYVSDVLRGNKAPGIKMLNALGLERVVTYRPRS